ncbi:hypothetical protein QA648_27135 (plasmid) [Rhizobium sp. CB3171]|uniref:hypothetical protein n=1 Tax=unclassified Rhizobium TaxID=2613769 RepID=UPI000CDF37B1|nr:MULTISPECIES: hypothetical protein [Rhizobium]AVA26012.1 hypothetical protein NXC24_PC01581 [Rhizobium sp. NXC24]MDK4742379.1 hypothetical protein [Rhizobium sp. CNPSo 3464]UWU23728.1 hypothetical protein N2601_26105 [Rhizobium tropici]WFU04459.1 hypothetical protein QA648_27135 [Rhizobium sp. CB3171]
MKAQITTLVAFAIFAASPASAIQRLQTASRSCSEIQSFVQANRSVILQYPSARGSGALLYDRAVANSDVCLGNGFGERSSVPSRDQRNCAIWVCRSSTDLRP